MTVQGSTGSTNGGGTRRGHLASAGEMVAAGKLVEAEQELQRVLEGSPKDVQALNLLALVRYKLGKLEDARATYREIAGAVPQDPVARRNLGLLALKLGRVDEALPDLEMAVRLAPNDERAWSYLGYAYAKRGEVVEAAAAFRRAKQDALAVELEHAATIRRPPTPTFHFGHISGIRKAPDVTLEPPAPPARPEPAVPTAFPGRAVAAVPEIVPVISGLQGPVALAPPLPAPIVLAEPAVALAEPVAAASPVAAFPSPELPPPSPELPPPAVEAVPVPLLAFVLARLGQGPAPAAPQGPLRLSIADEVHVRTDAVLAGAGTLEWQPAFRRAQGRHGTEPLGEGAGRFFRLTGSGDVWVAGAPSRWLPVTLVDDVLYVREDRVLAFDGGLSWEAGTLPGAGVRMLQFRGRGTVALELDQTPVAIKVAEERPTLLAGPRLIGWVGRLVPYGARLDAGAPFQLACQGEGVVLLDPGRR